MRCRDLVSMPSLGVSAGQKLTRRLKRQYNEINHVTPVRLPVPPQRMQMLQGWDRGTLHACPMPRSLGMPCHDLPRQSTGCASDVGFRSEIPCMRRM